MLLLPQPAPALPHETLAEDTTQLHGAMRSAMQKAREAREAWQHEMTRDLFFYRFRVKANGMVQLVLLLILSLFMI